MRDALDLTGAERDLLNRTVEEVRRFTGGDVHKETVKADAGKDFRKLDSFKRAWAGLPANIRSDISFGIRSRALALLAPPPAGETQMRFLKRLETSFDLSGILAEVRSHAQSIRRLRPDPLAEAVAMAGIEVGSARGNKFSNGDREAPSDFSRFLAKTLIDFLPFKYEIRDRLRAEGSSSTGLCMMPSRFWIGSQRKAR